MQKKIIDAFVSSKNEQMETPTWLFKKLNDKYHFVLDLAATAENKKCEYFLEDLFDPFFLDFLNLQKGQAVFINPPYGKKIKSFIQRAIDIADIYKVTLVMLLPARTCTKWFSLVWDRELNRPRPFFTIDFLEGRLTFELKGQPVLNQKSSKPSPALFPSMIVEYKPY